MQLNVVEGIGITYTRVSQPEFHPDTGFHYSLWLDNKNKCCISKINNTGKVSIKRLGIINGLNGQPLQIDYNHISVEPARFHFIEKGSTILVVPHMDAAGFESHKRIRKLRVDEGINQNGKNVAGSNPAKGKGYYGKHYQTHHILPYQEPDIKNHNLITLAQYNLKNDESNLIPLPTKSSNSTTQRSIHSGSHDSSYIDTIVKELDKIEARGQALGWTQADYKAEVDQLVSVLRSGLHEGVIALNKHHRPNAEFLSEDLLNGLRNGSLLGAPDDEPPPNGGGPSGGAADPRGLAKNLADATHNPSFEETIQTTNLEDTYNSTNPNQAIAKQGASSSEIGGVGIQAGLIQGIHHGLQDLINPNHVFLMPIENGEMPFTQPQLQQIIRELAIGIFVHDKKPMFSLHFNQDGSLFPVLGPEYEHTLVGYTMGMLDYIMKGFLNGAIFKEEFIKSWNERPNKDTSNDLNQLIDFKQHIAFHGVRGLPYRSVRECLHALGAAQNEDFDATFSTSFRIIADSPIRKAKDGFMIGTDFRVEYTIEGTPAFNSWLQRYQKEHGEPPAAYTNLLKAYEAMQQQIQLVMPKLPMCKAYFNMLSMIHFFSSYFKTLGDACKSPPVLRSIKSDFRNFDHNVAGQTMLAKTA